MTLNNRLHWMLFYTCLCNLTEWLFLPWHFIKRHLLLFKRQRRGVLDRGLKWDICLAMLLLHYVASYLIQELLCLWKRSLPYLRCILAWVYWSFLCLVYFILSHNPLRFLFVKGLLMHFTSHHLVLINLHAEVRLTSISIWALIICFVWFELGKAVATIMNWSVWMRWECSSLFVNLTSIHLLIVNVYLRLVLQMKRILLRFLEERLSLLRRVLYWVPMISYMRMLYLISTLILSLLWRIKSSTRFIGVSLSKGTVRRLNSLGILLLYKGVLSCDSINLWIRKTLRDHWKTTVIVSWGWIVNWLSHKLTVLRLPNIRPLYSLNSGLVRLISCGYQTLGKINRHIYYILFAFAVISWRCLFTLNLLLQRNMASMLMSLWLQLLLLNQLLLVLLGG